MVGGQKSVVSDRWSVVGGQRATAPHNGAVARGRNSPRVRLIEWFGFGWVVISVVREVMCDGQRGSTDKADFYSGVFLPGGQRGSGIGDCVNGGGFSPAKGRHDPAGETVYVSPTGSIRVDPKE